MKAYFLSLLVILVAASTASHAAASDMEAEWNKLTKEVRSELKTESGAVYHHARIVARAGNAVRVLHDEGVAKVLITDLPRDLKDQVEKVAALAKVRYEELSKEIEADKIAADLAGRIPGATPANTYLELQKRHFKVEKHTGEAPAWNCSRTDGPKDYTCEVMSRGGHATLVYSVVATVVDGSQQPDLQDTGDFLGLIAELPYTGAQPAAARAWVKEQVRTGLKGSKTIEGVTFTLDLNKGRYSVLSIEAAKTAH